MTSGLRKLHKFSWLLIALAGVVFFVFVIQNLDFSNDKLKGITTIEKDSSHPYKKAENELIKVWISGNDLTIFPTWPLKSSSSVVYELNENGEKGALIGQLQKWEGKAFEGINPDMKGIIIFDEIKGVEITKLEF